MTGIYFIAAGKSTRNRNKSLDRGFSTAELGQCVDFGVRERLKQHFIEGTVFAWGANKRDDLDQLCTGDYVVDVANSVVRKVFRYTFMIDTGGDTQVQEFLGWDIKARPYRYVFFLRAPMATTRTAKSFFQRAFGKDGNQQWLPGQKWFSDADVRIALQRTGAQSIEDLLGVGSLLAPLSTSLVIPQPRQTSESVPSSFLRPNCLMPVLHRVENLRKDRGHLEREHEDLVAHFFEVLGYSRGHEIKFQRGRVDIAIAEPGACRPNIVIEVKRDWALSQKSRDYILQAHKYAWETGARWVVLTNGDKYIVYDRNRGLSLDEQFEGEFELSRLTSDGLRALEQLSRRPLR